MFNIFTMENMTNHTNSISYHQCHLISAGLSGNKPTWRSIGWPIQSAISPPNNTIKTERFVRFSNQKQQKNNISFPPKVRWDVNLCHIPRLIKIQKPHFMKPNLILLLLFDPLTNHQTPKKKWAVPTGAGAGFTSPSPYRTSAAKIIHADWKKKSF